MTQPNCKINDLDISEEELDRYITIYNSSMDIEELFYYLCMQGYDDHEANTIIDYIERQIY